MKKGVIHFVQYVLVKILFFGAAYPLQAQVSYPSSWESFVCRYSKRAWIASDCKISVTHVIFTLFRSVSCYDFIGIITVNVK